MSWKIVYDVIFDRENDRLEKAIKEVSKVEGDTSFTSASSRAKGLFLKIRNYTDFWIEDIVEGGIEISRIENLKYMLDCVAKHAGRGPIKHFLPERWDQVAKADFEKLSTNVQALAGYTNEFANYIIGWENIKLDEPIQHEIKKQRPESYALLFSLHGSVENIEDAKYGVYVGKIKTDDYGLPGIVNSFQKIYSIFKLEDIEDPQSLEQFLRFYLSKDQFEWDTKIYPQLKRGIETLGEFLLKKDETRRKKRNQEEVNFEKIMNGWKDDLRNFELESVGNHGSTRKLRQKLAAKYEYGIEKTEE